MKLCLETMSVKLEWSNVSTRTCSPSSAETNPALHRNGTNMQRNKVAHNLDSESMFIAVSLCVCLLQLLFFVHPCACVFKLCRPCAWEILGMLIREATNMACVLLSYNYGWAVVITTHSDFQSYTPTKQYLAM